MFIEETREALKKFTLLVRAYETSRAATNLHELIGS